MKAPQKAPTAVISIRVPIGIARSVRRLSRLQTRTTANYIRHALEQAIAKDEAATQERTNG